jgi:hypothetical protein
MRTMINTSLVNVPKASVTRLNRLSIKVREANRQFPEDAEPYRSNACESLAPRSVTHRCFQRRLGISFG